MRAILGKPDCPDSSYILVLRGLDLWAIKYFHSHVKKYPTWGCLVFPDEGEMLSSPEGLVSSPIHKVFVDERYVSVSDGTLIKWVKEAFPPFSEDEMESSCDMGKPGSDHTAISIVRERIRSVSSDSVISAMELARLSSVFKDERFINEGVRRCKEEVLRKILDSPEFWNVDISTNEYTGDMRISVRIDVGISEKLPKKELLVDAVKGSSDAIKALSKSIGDGSIRVIDSLNSLTGENKDFML